MKHHHPPELSNVAPFDLYARKMPPKVWQPSVNFLAHAQDSMETNKPRTISSLVACHPRWDWKTRRIDFYAFGSFRSFLPTVTQVAEILAPWFQEFGILPVISPIETSAWMEIVANDGRPLLHIQRTGILVFNNRMF